MNIQAFTTFMGPIRGHREIEDAINLRSANHLDPITLHNLLKDTGKILYMKLAIFFTK